MTATKQLKMIEDCKTEIIQGDCLEVMKEYPDNYFSCIVTDPPYGLSFMNKGWDHETPGIEYWKECYRICKPGSFLLAMGGTRTFHRLTCAIEDAGWEIRDCISYLYGSGFPKSFNKFGADGYGTALKPAHEPIIMAMKPLDGTFKNNYDKWGQAGINIAATRVPVSDRESIPDPLNQRTVSFSSIESYRDGLSCISAVLRAYNNHDKDHLHNVLFRNGNLLSVFECEKVLNLLYSNGVWCGLNWKAIPSFQVDCPAYSHLRDELIPNVLKNAPISAPLLGDALDDIYQWIFSHTNNHLWRDNVLLSIEDVSALLHALIDPLFNPTLYLFQHKKSTGRWPANVLFDEEAAKMLDEQSGFSKSAKSSDKCSIQTNKSIFAESSGIFSPGRKLSHLSEKGDSGGASRFFYCAKTSPAERNEGLDCYITVKHDIDQKGDLWREENTAAVQLLQKVISEQALESFNIDVYGESITAQFHKDFSSIIRTKIKQIIESKTLNSSTLSPTNEFILDVVWWLENGLSHAVNVESKNLYQSLITNGAMVSALGVSNAALKMLSLISDEGNWKEKRSTHPTVKPLKLMEYLIKLVMPPKDGLLLDPFAGSGTTILAAKRLGFEAIGIEQSQEYCDIARARLA